MEIDELWERLERSDILDPSEDIETNLTKLLLLKASSGAGDFPRLLRDALTDYFNEKHRGLAPVHARLTYLRNFAKNVRSGDTVLTFNLILCETQYRAAVSFAVLIKALKSLS